MKRSPLHILKKQQVGLKTRCLPIRSGSVNWNPDTQLVTAISGPGTHVNTFPPENSPSPHPPTTLPQK